MRVVTFLTFAYLFLNSEGRHVSKHMSFGYHNKIGVPKARAILANEIGSRSSRIIGGSAVGISAIPHQAGIIPLLTSGWTSVCGGSLVSRVRVLTAAHCWWDGESQAKKFTIVLGSGTLFTGGTRRETTEIIVHANWNPRAQSPTNDIAMVKIQSVVLNNNIQLIPLPTTAEANLDFSGLTGTISGFGKTSDAQNSFPTTTALQHTTVPVITNTVCQRSFGFSLHSSHLCTSGQGRRGTCDGDSGGPLTVTRNNRRVLIGIVSFGLAESCQSGDPSVYTRVTSFLSWISSNM